MLPKISKGSLFPNFVHKLKNICIFENCKVISKMFVSLKNRSECQNANNFLKSANKFVEVVNIYEIPTIFETVNIFWNVNKFRNRTFFRIVHKFWNMNKFQIRKKMRKFSEFLTNIETVNIIKFLKKFWNMNFFLNSEQISIVAWQDRCRRLVGQGLRFYFLFYFLFFSFFVPYNHELMNAFF